jgi:hypothetical protein
MKYKLIEGYPGCGGEIISKSPNLNAAINIYHHCGGLILVSTPKNWEKVDRGYLSQQKDGVDLYRGRDRYVKRSFRWAYRGELLLEKVSDGL